jgi:hypothetical protein
LLADVEDDSDGNIVDDDLDTDDDSSYSPKAYHNSKECTTSKKPITAKASKRTKPTTPWSFLEETFVLQQVAAQPNNIHVPESCWGEVHYLMPNRSA